MKPYARIHAGVLLLLTVFCLEPVRQAQGEIMPFHTTAQNPLTARFSQPAPVSGRLPEQGEWRWQSQLVVTNTVNRQRSASQSLFMDFESHALDADVLYGLTDRLALGLTLPFIHRGGGIFDDAIENWHRVFGLPQADRPLVENNAYRIDYRLSATGPGRSPDSGSGLGDIRIRLGYQWLSRPDTAISLWGGLALPSGDSNALRGDKAWNLATWLAVDHTVTRQFFINGNLGLNLPNVRSGSLDAIDAQPVRTAVLFGQLALGWHVADWLDLKWQFDGHDTYYHSPTLPLLGSAYTTTFGGSIKLNACHRIDLAFTEDIKVEASPDVSLILGWRGRLPCRL